MPSGLLYLVVALLAFVENVFPPVPADTAVALGAFLSGEGRVSAPLIFGITWVCNVTGAAGMYLFARHVGRAFLRGRLGSRILKPAAVQRLETLYDRYGLWGIFFSRFIPGVRAVVPPFAGIARLSAPKALIPTAVASAIWYGTLTILVSRYVGEIHDVVRFMDRFSMWTWIVVGALVAVVAGILVMRRRAG